MKHILVVDDNVQIARIMAAVLGRYHVTVTHDGAEALARASRLPACDLLITDYLMPGMAGDEIAGRIREIHPNAKTLLVTGYGQLIAPDPGVVDAQLDKPFAPWALRETVAGLIGQPES
jgi:CheY-like chemotaxis protein